MAFERTCAHFMRCGELVVRGGLVVDVADSYPFEFPQDRSETEIEGGLVIFRRGAQGPCIMF